MIAGDPLLEPATLDALLDRVATPDRPDAPAFLGSASRGEFGARVRAAAGAFVRTGLPVGSSIAFGVRQDVAGIAWLLGALRAGLVVVVVDPGLAPEHLVAQCRTAGVSAVVLDGGVATVASHPILRAIAARLGLRLPATGQLAPAAWATSRSLSFARRLDRLAGDDGRRPLAPDAPALLLFTSGTTGRPRGVIHTAGSLAATMTMAAEAVAIGPDDRVLGAGLHLVAPALVGGAPILLAPQRGGVATLAEATRAADVTHVSLPLHRAVAWAGAGGAGPSLRHVVLGSAPVTNAGLAELVRLLPGVSISSIYGLSEHMLVAKVEARDRLAHDERTGDLVGTPLPRVGVRIADDDEVWIAGPGLARGYLSDTALEGPAAPSAELPTGDLGRLDDQGRLVLLGRRKHMLIRDGVNIYPALYEAPLAAAAGLEAAFLVGVVGATGNERVVLVGVPKDGEAPEQARRRLERAAVGRTSPLDRHARPDAVIVLRDVPRAGRSDKPDRAAISRAATAIIGREGS